MGHGQTGYDFCTPALDEAVDNRCVSAWIAGGAKAHVKMIKN